MKSPNEPVKVVLIDDSTVVRERMSGLLDLLAGVQVAGTAGDALMGWAALREHKPEVLILDLEMPGPSGMDLLKAVRAGHGKLIVIVLTIHNDRHLRKACLEIGADYFFNKATEFEAALNVCAELGANRLAGKLVIRPNR